MLSQLYKIDPIILLVVMFIITYYISYSYITKDNKDDIGYENYIYCTIPSVIMAVVSYYLYNMYNNDNSGLLKEPYYGNNIGTSVDKYLR